MKTDDLFHETFAALLANKARTALTMLGIVIGIGSVIALVSIGQGAQASINSSINALGSNLIEIMPGATQSFGGPSAGRGGATTLTNADAGAIASSVADITAVSPELTGRYQIVAKGANTNTTVLGVTSAYPAVHNLQVAEGDFVSDQDNKTLAKVAVLGPTVLTDLFGDDATADAAIGQTIRVNGQLFKVIGVTVAKGGSGFTSQDDQIFIPLQTEQKYLAGGTHLSTVSIEAASADAMAQVQADVTSLLLERHKISDPTKADFSILNQNDLLSTASSITGTFTLLLGAIAGISLLVGGIGIMNMMLTTVTERTREIGLRKAIGAKRRDISMQFLAEAVALTLVGGAVGLALGAFASFLIASFTTLAPAITLSSVALAIGVSAGIGIVFGYYPARRAAALNPIDALRYE
ncbi:MAG TPA: ABC transporter permease [Candidatus Paceibacterota bacterium]